MSNPSKAGHGEFLSEMPRLYSVEEESGLVGAERATRRPAEIKMSERLDLIRPYLSRYTRRFTVLDFGAGINVPAIGTEIAREFDACVVCVEKDIVSPEPGAMWLKKEFSPRDLQLMSECEHFDVVIGFNICHWFTSTVPLEILQGMGRYVFIQVPGAGDETAWDAFGQTRIETLARYFVDPQWQHLGNTVQFPQHQPRPIWMHENATPRALTRTNVDAHDDSANTHLFESKDQASQIAILKSGIARQWHPGINLHNFLRWNGVQPARERIAELLERYPLPSRQHGDVTLHNFIIDGEQLHLIDGFENWGGDDKQNLYACVQAVRAM